MGTWFYMSGINYYDMMEHLYKQLQQDGKKGVRKVDFLNRFIRDQGLNLQTGRRKFEEACTIDMIQFVGRDDEGYELIHVVSEDEVSM